MSSVPLFSLQFIQIVEELWHLWNAVNKIFFKVSSKTLIQKTKRKDPPLSFSNPKVKFITFSIQKNSKSLSHVRLLSRTKFIQMIDNLELRCLQFKAKSLFLQSISVEVLTLKWKSRIPKTIQVCMSYAHSYQHRIRITCK